MKKNLTEIVFILDKSGSMHGLEINVRAIPLSLDDGSSGLNVIM